MAGEKPIILQDSDFAIRRANVDFLVLGDARDSGFGGTKTKKIVRDLRTRELALFKLRDANKLRSEDASEKIAYELAKLLGLRAARIELAVDKNGEEGVLSYLFSDKEKGTSHINAGAFLDIKDKQERRLKYHISDVQAGLIKYGNELFEELIKILVFDALVGEADRQEENWGLLKTDKGYQISPLYDTASCLLAEFKSPSYREQFNNGRKELSKYILHSPTPFIKESPENGKYRSFELIRYLRNSYSEIIDREVQKIAQLELDKIQETVNKIPNERLENEHKRYIIEYIRLRQNKLKEICNVE